jgi:DNA-binding response OmpR family regulator
MKRAKGRKRQPSIRFKQDGSSNLALFINDRSVTRSRTRIALFHLLWKNNGRVIPYKRLCLVIGHSRTGRRQLHLLRQYIRWIKGTLATQGVPYLVATSPGIGYALCEVAGL